MPTSPAPKTPWILFSTFAVMGLQGFGGVMPWARRTLVDQRGWLDDKEFAEMLSLSQILPGPNICNMASILGYRWCGVPGAVAAVVGLLGPSALVVLALGLFYEHIRDLHGVNGAVRGMASAAAGLVAATAIKLTRTQPRNIRGPALGIAALIAVGIMHWPLLWVLVALIPTAVVFEVWARGRSTPA